MGAFRVEYSDAVSSSNYHEGSIGFVPPNGHNGSYGSFVTDSSEIDAAPLAIAEFQIPSTLGAITETNPNNLPVATHLQGYVDIESRVSANPENNRNIGLIQYINGKLLVGTYKSYDADGVGPEKMVLFDDATDLANCPVSSWIDLEGRDRTISWMSELPSNYQTVFGATHVSGNGAGMSIASRFSDGPSFYLSNPGELTTASTILPTTEKMGWNPAHSMAAGDYVRADQYEDALYENWDSYNEATLNYYMDALDYDVYDYLHFASHMHFAVGDLARSLADHNLYRNLTGVTGEEPSSDSTNWALANSADRSFIGNLSTKAERMSALEGVAASQPVPENLHNTLWTRGTQARFGFVIPNTSTYIVLGNNAGFRFGMGYKAFYADADGFVVSPGNSAIVRADTVSWVWAFDVNDIQAATTTNPSSVRPYLSAVFDNSRWMMDDGYGNTTGNVTGAFYDPVNNRLYVGHYRTIPSNDLVVAVYDMGGL